MAKDKFSDQAVKVFKALADPTRYQIVTLVLERGEMGCMDFDKEFRSTKSALSHHYRILENADLIITRKEGQHVFVSLNMEVLNKYLPGFKKTHLNKI